MTELTDDIINGFQCAWCEVYFEKEHGYQVVCDHCWEHATNEERKSGVKKAIHAES